VGQIKLPNWAISKYRNHNHTQFSAINTTALFNASGAQTNSQFGQYTATQNPRILQWAVRLQF
jgi:hypothetical protein